MIGLRKFRLVSAGARGRGMRDEVLRVSAWEAMIPIDFEEFYLLLHQQSLRRNCNSNGFESRMFEKFPQRMRSFITLHSERIATPDVVRESSKNSCGLFLQMQNTFSADLFGDKKSFPKNNILRLFRLFSRGEANHKEEIAWNGELPSIFFHAKL